MGLTKEQLAFRRQGLTATDLVVLAGESPYGDTLYDVYAEKCAPEPTKRPSSEQMEWGNRIEPLIVRAVAEDRNVCVSYPCNTSQSSTTQWALATVDARVVAASDHMRGSVVEEFGAFTESLLECKVVGHRKAHTWPEPGEDALPPDWVTVQATWQMFVTGVHKCTVAALLGTELRTYDLTYDAELGEGLVDIGAKFWKDHILKRSPPPVDGSEASREMLARIWPKQREGMILATSEADELARAYMKAKQAEKEAKAMADLAAAKLQEMVKDHSGIDGRDWRLHWSYREPTRIEAYDRAGYRHFDLRIKKERNK